MLLCGRIQNGHSIAATAVNFFKSFEFLRKTLFSGDDGGTIALFDSGDQLGDEGGLGGKLSRFGFGNNRSV